MGGSNHESHLVFQEARGPDQYQPWENPGQTDCMRPGTVAEINLRTWRSLQHATAGLKTGHAAVQTETGEPLLSPNPVASILIIPSSPILFLFSPRHGQLSCWIQAILRH